MWNRILHSILRTADAPHPTAHPTRVLAMMHLAIADAVSAISRRFEPYGAKLPVAPYASQTAAAAQAAHDVLVALYPSLTPSLDANLAAALHTVRDGLNQNQRHRRRGPGGTGDPDAAMEGPPLSDTVAVRPPRPRSVPARPARRSAARLALPAQTREEAAIAQFWSAPIHDYWNEIAQTASRARGHSASTDARLFAALNASLADAVIAAHDARDRYRSTPGDPTYPSVHSAVSFAAAEILSDQFSRRMHFDVTSSVRPDMERHFTTFAAAAREAGLSRIYRGDHVRVDHLAGARLGRRIGRFALRHALMLRPDGRA